MFGILIAGSRGFNDYGIFKQVMDKMLINHKEVTIISGGAKGADSLAEQYAKERNIPIRVFPAQWDRYGKSAGYKRNSQMHEALHEYDNRGCICFWDGKSPGTQHNFKLAKDGNTPLKVFDYTKKKFIKV